MADTTLTVAADTSQASRAIADLSSQFSRLQGVIAGIGFGQLIQSSIDFANNIQQSSRATGIAIETTAAFANAVQEAGGSAAEAAKDLIGFTAGLDEAAQGSSAAQTQLARVGITLRDLGTLSNQDLFEKTVKGIAVIGDASTRNRLAVQLLGKSFKDIDVRTVAAGFAAAPKMDTAGIEAAAAAQKNLQKIFDDFRLVLIDTIKPLSDFVKTITVSKDEIKVIVNNITDLALALGGLFVAFKVLVPLKEFLLIIGRTGSIAAAVPAIGEVSAGLAGLSKAASGFAYLPVLAYFGEFRNLLLSLARNISYAIGGFVRLIPVIGGIIAVVYALNTALELLTQKSLGDWFDEAAKGLEKFMASRFPELTAAINKLGSMLGMAPSTPPPPLQSPEEIANDLKREQNRADARKKELENQRRVIDAQREQALAQRKIVDGYRESNFFANLQMINERGLVGLNDERAAKQQKLNDFDLAYSKQIYDLTKQKVELERAAAVGTDEERAKSAAFNKAYAGTKAALDKEYAVQRGLLSDNIDLLQGVQTKERDRLANLDRITAAMERQTAQATALKDAQLSIKEATQGVEFERSLQGKSPLQKQMAQIGEDNRKAALAAGRAFAAAFEENGDGLTPERAAELAKGLEAIATAYEDIADAQRESLSASRDLNVGIKEAFKTFIEEAGNEAEKAKKYFSVFANGFENIFVSMTKGFPGVKRAIKDLGTSLIEEFLRIQAKNLLAAILGGTGGTVTVGGLGGGVGSTGVSAGSGLLGLMAGGKSMGRGLLDGLFTGGSGGFSPEVANATGASIFAMGFAAGGPVMANRPVMVGERGPELFMPGVAGSIIPNNQLKGGENNSNNTNVTYNINAVDASSFRSLVARDPSFIFNISEVGRRSTPQRSV